MWREILAVWIGLQFGNWICDDLDLKRLEGKRVVVTGASTGIGEQIAYHYAKYGANVLITARRKTRLEQVVARCREFGHSNGQYEYIAADMNNMSATAEVIQAAKDRLGGIDILVLNHIIVLPLGEWKGSHDNLTSLQQVLDVNFRAYVHLASHAIQELEKNNGNLIVVSSLVGKVATPFVAAYSASKFALEGFFSAWRQELKMKNSGTSITLCIIGFVGTDNALSKVLDFGQTFLLSIMKPASPEDTAVAIIKGGLRREREICFPYLDVRIPYLLRDWMPNVIEFIMRFITVPDHFSK